MTECRYQRTVDLQTLRVSESRGMAYRIVGRELELSLRAFEERSAKRREPVVWSSLAVVSSLSTDGRLVHFDVTCDLVPPEQQNAALQLHMVGNSAPDRAARAEARQMAAEKQAGMATAALREIARQLDVVRAMLVNAPQGATADEVRRMLAVLNGEATTPDEAPVPSADAAEPWRE